MDEDALHPDFDKVVFDSIFEFYILQRGITNDTEEILKLNNELENEHNLSQLSHIRRDVYRNIADSLREKEENSSTLFELDSLFMEHNSSVFPMNIRILDDNLYYADEIDHYLHIIETPLSVIRDQYSDIVKIKSFITNNKVTTKEFISMFKESTSYSKYFMDSFDMIDDIDIKNFITSTLETTNSNANQLSNMVLNMHQKDIQFEAPNPLDGRRICKSILESFNILKIRNYWSSLDIRSEFIDGNEFSIEIIQNLKESEKQYDFKKLKPNFEIKENSVTAIWYLVLLHAFSDGAIDKTESLLLVNTLKVCLYTTASVHQVEDFDNYVKESTKDNDLLMDFVKNEITKINKLSDIELWDAYLSAADKITDPNLQDLTIAICVWVAQKSNTDLQHKGVGKLVLEWHKYSDSATARWLEEIQAFASGEKG